MSLMNRLHNCKNPYQGSRKRVLCVCSAGLLRSPTTAFVLSNEPFGFNTRAAGVHNYALVPVDKVLITWAQEIVCMEKSHRNQLEVDFGDLLVDKVVNVLNIPDNYEYRDPELMEMIKALYIKATGFSSEPRGEIVPEKSFVGDDDHVKSEGVID